MEAARANDLKNFLRLRGGVEFHVYRQMSGRWRIWTKTEKTIAEWQAIERDFAAACPDPDKP